MCCAYYLAKRRVHVTLLEGEKIACAASGKAGDFLSQAPSLTSDDTIGLQCRSFHLHEQLAQEFDGARHYDFRQIQTFYVDLEGSPNHPKSASPTWISRSARLTPLYSRDEFAGMCVDKLRIWLSAAGLDWTGKKAVLVQRAQRSHAATRTATPLQINSPKRC